MVKAEKSGKRTHDTCSTETIIRRESVDLTLKNHLVSSADCLGLFNLLFIDFKGENKLQANLRTNVYRFILDLPNNF